MSTEAQVTENTSNSQLPDESSIMPLPAQPAGRAIAAFVDYLVLMALLMFFSGYIFSFDYEFLWSLILGCCYFGIGNSEILGGQTLGKRAFGIRVVGPNGPISLAKSFLRYTVAFGLPLLLVGIPPLLLRSSAVVAAPSLTELNMLAVLVYSIWNFSAILVRKSRRAMHDVFSSTMVVQVTKPEDKHDFSLLFKPDGVFADSPKQATWISIALGFVFGSVLWWYSVQQPVLVESIHRNRFQIEQQFGIRILSLSARSDGIVIDIAALSQAKNEIPNLVERLALHIQANELLPENQRQKVLFVVLVVSEGYRNIQPLNYTYLLENGRLTRAEGDERT